MMPYQTATTHFRHYWRIAALAAALAASSQAGTIASETGTYGYGYTANGQNTVAITWTQTQAYQNVTISAPLYGFGSSTTTLVQLTNALGSGTTAAANQIASATVTDSIGSPSFVTLFTGLSLGPGTYYVVASQGFAWYGNTTGTTTGAAGVSGIANLYTTAGVNSYAPSSTFGVDPGNQFFFSVTGNAVASTPEPASTLMVCVSIVGMIGYRGRRRATCWGGSGRN